MPAAAGISIRNRGMAEDIHKRNPMKVLINQHWCKGCGVCAAFCPSRALSLDSGGKAVWEPSLCTGCGLCELYCPDLAVECLRDDTKTNREGV